LLIFLNQVLIVNRQELWLCVVPLPSSTFGSWRALVRNAEFEQTLMLSKHPPPSNYTDGDVKQAKIICPPTSCSQWTDASQGSIPTRDSSEPTIKVWLDQSPLLWCMMTNLVAGYKPGPTAVSQGNAHVVFDEEDWNRCPW